MENPYQKEFASHYVDEERSAYTMHTSIFFLSDRLLKRFSAVNFASIGASVHDCHTVSKDRKLIAVHRWIPVQWGPPCKILVAANQVNNSCTWPWLSPSYFYLLIKRPHQKMKTSDGGHFKAANRKERVRINSISEKACIKSFVGKVGLQDWLRRWQAMVFTRAKFPSFLELGGDG